MKLGLSGGAADIINSYLASSKAAKDTDNDTLRVLHQWKAANALNDLKSQYEGFDLANLQKDFENPREKNTAEDADGNAQTTGLNVSISLEADTGKKGSCHLFRHTCATLMLESGADVRYIQALLGHAKLETTGIYTQVSIKQLKDVHTLAHPAKISKNNERPDVEV